MWRPDVLETSPNGAGKFAPLSSAEVNAAKAMNGVGSPHDDGAVCLMPVPRDAPRAADPRGAVATWQYNDASGQQLYRVHRFDDPSGKRFSWQTAWRLRGGVVVWRWKAPNGPRPIYGLDRLAARQDAPVVVAEGEKASDAAQRIFPELVAVTSPGGAEAPAKADWDVLAGRRVLLWPDADEPGARYVATVASRLQGLASEIKILDAKALASINPDGGEREPVEGWDAADAELEWKDKGELRRALKSLTRTYESTGEGSVSHVNEAHSPQHWPVPKALPSGLLAVPQFDLAFLPNSVASWIADIADRMQCPLEYVAVPAIVALGAALGRKVAIRPQRRTDWLETPNLWGCVVGRPGAMKSPAATEALMIGGMSAARIYRVRGGPHDGR
jgi:hypothetical protein